MSRYLHPSCVYKCVAPHCQLSLSFYSVSSVSCLAFLNYCGLCILVLACIWIIAFVRTVDIPIFVTERSDNIMDRADIILGEDLREWSSTFVRLIAAIQNSTDLKQTICVLSYGEDHYPSSQDPGFWTYHQWLSSWQILYFQTQNGFLNKNLQFCLEATQLWQLWGQNPGCRDSVNQPPWNIAGQLHRDSAL